MKVNNSPQFISNQLSANKETADQKRNKAIQNSLIEKDNLIKQANSEFQMNAEKMEDEKNKLRIGLACLTIARRIQGGDNVPPKDHQFLLKHDPAMYVRSISMRFPKDKPYNYKSISKHIKDNDDEWQIGEPITPKMFNAVVNGDAKIIKVAGDILDIKI